MNQNNWEIVILVLEQSEVPAGDCNLYILDDIFRQFVEAIFAPLSN